MTSLASFEVESFRAPRGPATVRVALAGCGAVGSALLRELVARRETMARRHDVEVIVARILVRDAARERAAPFDRALLTTDVDDFLATDVNVVVEAIGGLDPAGRIARAALTRGRDVVTANKELLAAHGSELTGLAARHHAALRYDAAVGGGVPILRLLDDALGGGTPTVVRGILNGTSNYVLSRLERGDGLETALRAARAAGFAEADASRDLDGRDAAAKLALVAWATFGIPPESVVVRRRSLLPDPARLLRLAVRLDRTVRQVAECALVEGSVVASVEPLLVERGSALAATSREQNRVEVHTGWSAPLCASGPGAGGVPTATALLSDLLSNTSQRRRVASAGVASVDRRPSSWALEIRGAPALLHRLVPASGFVHTDATASCAWTIIEAVTPSEIDRLAAALAERGAHPVAIRFDDAAVTADPEWS
jgi:homoserine dehydrogenase